MYHGGTLSCDMDDTKMQPRQNTAARNKHNIFLTQ